MVIKNARKKKAHVESLARPARSEDAAAVSTGPCSCFLPYYADNFRSHTPPSRDIINRRTMKFSVLYKMNFGSTRGPRCVLISVALYCPAAYRSHMPDPTLPSCLLADLLLRLNFVKAEELRRGLFPFTEVQGPQLVRIQGARGGETFRSALTTTSRSACAPYPHIALADAEIRFAPKTHRSSPRREVRLNILCIHF